MNPRWEVAHFTLCDGWVNTWSILANGEEVPETFETQGSAQEALDEFLSDASEHGYGKEDFLVRPVGGAS